MDRDMRAMVFQLPIEEDVVVIDRALSKGLHLLAHMIYTELDVLHLEESHEYAICSQIAAAIECGIVIPERLMLTLKDRVLLNIFHSGQHLPLREATRATQFLTLLERDEEALRALSVLASAVQGAQNRDGGWGFYRTDHSRIPATSAALQVLAKCRTKGLDVDQSVLDRGYAFLTEAYYKDLARDRVLSFKAAQVLSAYLVRVPEIPELLRDIAGSVIRVLHESQSENGSWTFLVRATPRMREDLGSVAVTSINVDALTAVLAREEVLTDEQWATALTMALKGARFLCATQMGDGYWPAQHSDEYIIRTAECVRTLFRVRRLISDA
ncbi:MAG: hypothetical protein ACP5PX_07125 [Candidatus Hadarchaeum sp.]